MNVSWSLIEYMEGGGEKRIKDICQVSFLDKLVNDIITKRERKKDKFLE